jgi:hypothetical protein
MTTITPLTDLSNGMRAGHPYLADNHGGHYYWIIWLGCWMDKDLFRTME